jgi:hypothetical protein
MKLFVLVKCTICLGKALTCAYCNGQSTTYIEAADTVIGKWLSELSEERLQLIKKMVKSEENK